MLEKKVIVDLIEVLENGCVQVRTNTSIWEDGKQISSTYHRNVIVPGQDYSKETPRVQAVCKAVQTPECIALYEASLPK